MSGSDFQEIYDKRIEEKNLKAARRLLKTRCYWYPDKFAKIYLNHYVPARYARHHYDLFKALPHGAQGEKANILAPRGSAKLTLMAVIFPIYRICYAKYNEIIILNFLPSIPHTNTFICKIGFDTVNREFPVVRDRGNNRSIRIAFHKNIT